MRIKPMERIALSDSDFERAVSRSADWISWSNGYDEYAYEQEYTACLRRLDGFLTEKLRAEGVCEISRASIPCFGATITIFAKRIATSEWFESIVSWFERENRFEYLYLSYDIDGNFDADILIKRNAIFGSGKHLSNLGLFEANQRPLQDLFPGLSSVDPVMVWDWYQKFQNGIVGCGVRGDFIDQFLNFNGELQLNRVCDLEFLSLRKSASIRLADFNIFNHVQRMDLSMATVIDWPSLMGFTRLKGLTCADASGVDLSVACRLKELEWLNLTGAKNLNLTQLSGLISLRQICLTGTKIASYRNLTGCPMLRIVRLPFNNIRNVSQLPVENSLVTLDVAVNEIEEVIVPVAWQGLKELDIGSNRINHLRWVDLLPQLQELNVSGNEIKELGGIETLSNLRVLNLTRTRIKDFRLLNKCLQLESLLLDDGAIDAQQRQKLQEANPRLRIKLC